MSKNKEFQRRVKAAKAHAKKWRRGPTVNKAGNAIYHCYGGEFQKEKGWWDDFSFRYGSQIIMVWWTHPRMGFSDETEEKAHYILPYKSEKEETFESLFGETTPVYKYLGKNKKRKKIILYKTKDTNRNHFREWNKKYVEVLREVRTTTDLVVKPSFSVEQLGWCRGVSICAPLEVIDEASIDEMGLIVRKLLARETTIAELYPDYTYTKEDWAAEGWPSDH